MASIADYPISFPFGATSAPYSPSKPHHGDDRAAPSGTPIIVSGKNIGLVGSTGFSSGPHLHVDKNPNYPATSGYVKPTNPFSITGKVVFAGDAGTAGRMTVIKTADAYWRFLHQSQINVKAGDIIQGGTIMPTEAEVKNYFQVWLGRQPTADELANHIKKSWSFLADAILLYVNNKWQKEADSLGNLAEDRRIKLENTRKALAECQAGGTVLSPGTYKVT